MQYPSQDDLNQFLGYKNDGICAEHAGGTQQCNGDNCCVVDDEDDEEEDDDEFEDEEEEYYGETDDM